ncbi:hypothetical protein SYNPS1DRAFT_30521 [Syncephalis pseudoplumigaleata]|uniref:Ribosomal lysine N-methyltransferase 4 n=1 Tax=Syncephalis pseudoplumigaleata TaxID=1712513 RepID=A0A4P9YV35_9FUNG|nr:hypothetical protein SYNPS1DRAFT_30521 [Syncephalis pseudoplumigaleata]|eukprot:RKP23724.1 hypothetical protein SYNPS1DRAFT_30521 [Syncephalis pseudoplumigaleata]
MSMDQATKTQQLQRLLVWFDEHKVWYDKERLEIRVVKEMTGYELGIFARKPLKEDDIVCRIARSAILSAKNCGITNILEDAMCHSEGEGEEEEEGEGGLSDRVALTLGVMFELARGETSPWYGYLQSLPQREPLPIFWSDEPLAWLKGTELEESIGKDKHGIKHDYDTQVVPLLKQAPDLFANEQAYTFEQFMRVSSLVASRAFFVDDYHGEAMVPLADIFNHKTCDEHVHLEFDLDVCLVCGAAFGCEHAIDPEDPPFSMLPPGVEIERALQETDAPVLIDTAPSDDEEHSDAGYGDGYGEEDGEEDEDEEDRLEMSVVQEARPGDEVYNTYGYHGNAHLLARYGFAEDVNPCDVVGVHMDVIRTICEPHATSPAALEERLDFFATHIEQFQPNEGEEEEEEEEEDAVVLPEYFGITFGGMPDPLLAALLAVIRMRDDAFAACQQSPLHMARSIDMLRSLVEDTLDLLSQESGGAAMKPRHHHGRRKAAARRHR